MPIHLPGGGSPPRGGARGRFLRSGALAWSTLAALSITVGIAVPPEAAAKARPRTGVVEVSPGRTLFYREVGRGPTVILVHGALLDYECWNRTADALAPHARVIAVSRYGHYPDSTSQDSAHYSFEQNAIDLVGFVRALKLGPVHLVGHSYGGVVVMLAAMQAPAEVRSLTLVDPYAVSLIADSAARAALVERRKIILREVADAPTPDRRLRLLLDGITGSEHAFDTLNSEQLAMLRRNARTAPWLNKPQPVIRCSELETFKGDVLLVLGSRSDEVFHEIGEGWMSCRPHTRRVTIEGAGHFAMWDRPEDLARVIRTTVGEHRR